MAQALVPLKDLVQAKTRLAGLLAPSERRALAQAMAEDVLSVLAAHPLIEKITLVSDDPGAELLAQRYGADCWPEKSLGCRGLNAILQCATERLLAGDAEDVLLVMHADLPLLTAEDISTVVARQEAIQGLVVGCDRHGRGTNLLAFNALCTPAFRFGAGSRAAHERGARHAGVPVEVLQRQGIGIDVDEPADLRTLLTTLARDRSRTFDLLRGTGLGARLSMTLDTLPNVTAAQGAADSSTTGEVNKSSRGLTH